MSVLKLTRHDMLFGDVTLGYLSCWGKLPANAVCLPACLPMGVGESVKVKSQQMKENIAVLLLVKLIVCEKENKECLW